MATILTAESIAAQYLAGADSAPHSWELARFRGWLTAAYAGLAGLVDTTAAEVSPEEFMAVWKHCRRLLISTANSEHPVWDIKTNTQFRAVHDWHHLQAGGGFGWEGELAACRYAERHSSTAIHWILRSEVLGQAAVAITTGAFPEQKLVRTIVA